MRLDSTPKMEIQIGVSYTRYFMRSVWFRAHLKILSNYTVEILYSTYR